MECKTLNATFTTTEDEHVEAYFLFPEVQRLVEHSGDAAISVAFLAITLAVLGAAFATRQPAIIVAAFGTGILIVAFAPVTRRLEAKLILRRLERALRSGFRRGSCHVHNIQISEIGIVDECPCGRDEKLWSSVTDWHENAQLIVVRFRSQSFHILPKRAFSPGDFSEVARLVRENVVAGAPAGHP